MDSWTYSGTGATRVPKSADLRGWGPTPIFTFWFGTRASDGVPSNFTTEGPKNRGGCTLVVNRADVHMIEGRVQCTRLTGYLYDRSNVLYEPRNAPTVTVVAAFSGQAGG
jgi:hypothetical protein